MAIKLVAIDIDDTLLNSKHEITDRTRDALYAAQDKGCTVILVTGRMYAAAKRYAKALGLNTPLMTCQGAQITDIKTDEVLYSRTVPLALAREVADICEARGLHIQYYIGDNYYYAKEGEPADYYAALAGFRGIPVGSPVSEKITEEPVKMLCLDQPDVILQLQQEMIDHFGGKLAIAISKPRFLEFTHPEAIKGRTVANFANQLGIAQEEVMAIGDSFNDITMIQYAGKGVAMGNADARIKAVADEIAPSNDEDGVAVMIEKYVLA